MSDNSPFDPVHALPPELILFLRSTIDAQAILPLLLVCRTARSWLLPVLYHSITFTTAAQLSGFLSHHDVPNDPMEDRFSWIHNLFIGGTSAASGDLAYGSTNWPLTVVSRILWLSTSLQSLTIIDLDQNKWHKLEHAIPASLERLALGPVHGPFHPQDLKQRPRLEHLTSALTYMRDDEVRDVVCCPSMKTFRRILESGMCYAADQVGCISKSDNLEILEIVVSGPASDDVPTLAVLEMELKENTDDPRVVLVEDTRNWLRIIHEEYQERRNDFIAAQIS